jgi:hypothetical protein
VWWCPCLDRVGLLALYVECVYKEDYLCLKYILKFRIPVVYWLPWFSYTVFLRWQMVLSCCIPRNLNNSGKLDPLIGLYLS